MNIKFYFLCACILFLGKGLLSQDATETKLNQAFTSQKANQIKSNSQKLSYYTELINNSYELTEMNSDKLLDSEIITFNSFTKIDANKNEDQISVSEFISEIESDDFNILLYRFERSLDKNLLIRLGSTSKILKLDSIKTITTKSRENK